MADDPRTSRLMHYTTWPAAPTAPLADDFAAPAVAPSVDPDDDATLNVGFDVTSEVDDELSAAEVTRLQNVSQTPQAQEALAELHAMVRAKLDR